MMVRDRASYILERTAKYDSKKIRQSEVFKNRLNLILKSIEDAAKSGQNRLVIISMDNCHTDLEIRKALSERDFKVRADYEGPHTLRIRWTDRRNL